MRPTTQLDAPMLLEQAIGEICRLLDTCDGLHGMRLLTRRRLAYTELTRLQAHVQLHHLVIILTNPNEIHLRRRRHS
jgi:hypothetical protein